MSRDIINACAVQDAINELLEGAPSALRRYMPSLRAWLRTAADRHQSVRRARRRISDPAWAQDKFNEGHTLYRFYAKDFFGDWELEEVLEDLKKVAEIASGGAVLSHDAQVFLRGLPHRRLSLNEMGRQTGDLIERADLAALRVRRHEVLRDAASISVQTIVGTVCESIEQITRLGREAHNCLAEGKEYWKRFDQGQIDVWSLREGTRLVAILQVNCATRQIVEAFGPSNTSINIRDVWCVAQFCGAAGFGIGDDCEGLLPDYAAPLLVEPTLVKVGNQIALYAEWPTAVRIDLSRSGRFARRNTKAQTLAISFDPNKPCAEDVFDGNDPLALVMLFGRKKIRKIVRSVALNQVAPSLVQHRLLALAA